MIVEQEEDEIMALVVAVEDPETFEKSAKYEKWRKAIEAEMKAINDNNTWELVDVPEGVIVIGVKWGLQDKTQREVDNFNASLVAKGYHQTYGVDFYEVFATVDKWDTIKLILGFAAQEGWVVLQLEVKSAFLQGDLSEDVFVEQPKGFHFEVAGESEKVYKLQKALYGLRHAIRVCYSRIESYFQERGSRSAIVSINSSPKERKRES